MFEICTNNAHAPFNVEYYEDSTGHYPVEAFILSQSIKMQAKIFRTIELLENYGNTLREPYSKHLDDGIFELRIKLGTETTRILYFFVINKTIILTNGFTKKTDKTPAKELLLAKQRRDAYYLRMRKSDEQEL